MTEYAQLVTDPSTGRQKYRWEGLIEWEYPFDPDKPVMLLVAPPGGPAHANWPFIIKGDAGKGAVFTTTPSFTALEWNDPTPDSFEVVELAPATESTPQVLKAVVKLHKGQPGTNGASVLNPASFGTVAYKRMLQVKADGTGFELVPQKVGGMHYPTAAALAAPPGTAGAFTVQRIDVPANTYGFPWRPDPTGGTVVTASTADAQVDLVARLNATNGPVIGRCPGIGGVTDRLILAGGLDDSALAANAASAVTDVTIAANAAATFYLRTEKVSGAATYQSSAAATRYGIRAIPVP